MPAPRTMEEFADAAGLSRPTVSKFFNDPASVRPATRARLEAAMAALDYQPNFHALNQNRRASKTLGILVPQLTDPFTSEIVRRIEVRAMAAGHWPVLLSSHGSAQHEARGIDLLRSMRVAGVLVAPLGDASDLGRFERLAADVPVVVLDTPLPGGLPFVGTDNAGGIGRLVAHLCDRGEPPCFLGFPDFNATARERRDAYLAAMAARGEAPALLPEPPGAWDLERIGRDAVAAALAAGGLPRRALLCACDRLAFGALAAAHAAGLRVGPDGDLLVAGHDDHPLAAYACPALTTVAQDYDALAEAAMAALAARIDGRDAPSRRLPSRLVVRASA